jgi:hypothetical protein
LNLFAFVSNASPQLSATPVARIACISHTV